MNNVDRVTQRKLRSHASVDACRDGAGPYFGYRLGHDSCSTASSQKRHRALILPHTFRRDLLVGWHGSMRKHFDRARFTRRCPRSGSARIVGWEA